jgi:hypothetical protein
MTMVRSVPVGIWVDQDLRARFPDLRAAQEPVHSLDGYAGGPLTGFQVGCLIHAGVQGLSPGTKTGGTHHRGGVEAGTVAGS